VSIRSYLYWTWCP